MSDRPPHAGLPFDDDESTAAAIEGVRIPTPGFSLVQVAADLPHAYVPMVLEDFELGR